MKRIFISYSHKDETWKDRLIAHLKTLELQGELEVWDDRKIKAGTNWFPEIQEAMNRAEAAIMLISANYLSSTFIHEKEIPVLLQGRAEKNLKVFPLIIRDCPWKAIDWLSSLQLRPTDGKALSRCGSKIDTMLANFALEIRDILSPVPQQKQEESVEKTKHPVSTGSAKVFISKLPVTGENLFGREKELELLDQAWEDPDIHVFSLVAWGGVGKSALVNEWLNRMAVAVSSPPPNQKLLEVQEPFLEKVPGRRRQIYCGACRVYAWSFYSQGAAEGKQASAEEFLQHALDWFGDEEPGAGSDVDKGRRLAELVRKEKTLLILDGMEPLQYPPGEIQGFDGQLKDHGLRTLLKELAGTQPGLCVITSREPIADLRDKKGRTYRELELEHLSMDAGVQLVKSLGVTGGDREIAEAVEEYGGHALALTLLGNYLAAVHHGDIRQRDMIPALTMDKKRGHHARRVMEAYERWLGESPELNILRIMGLFDRPVEKGAIDALTAQDTEPIPGITEKLAGLTAADWGFALANLRGVGMLAKEDPHKPDVLDCHPLVREHFGGKLRNENPKGWRVAHHRLYEYYKALPGKAGKELPDTLAEMEPLFAAVAHGCAAGLHQKAMDEVYWPRIRRGKEAYTVKKLGAFGSDLATLSHFFQEPWGAPADGLTDHDKASVLSWAGFRLRSLGRLQEAGQAMKTGLELRIKQENWLEAAKDAGNLSELSLTLGRVDEAVDYASRSVDYADQSKNWVQQTTKRTTLADTLHQQGKLEEAEHWFREAEAMQRKSHPGYTYLFSLQGIRFCDLLLGQGKYREVLERAEHGLKVARESGFSLLTFGLEKLSLGRASLMQTLAEKTGDFSMAEAYLAQAVEGLRHAGTQHMLPLALFAHAELFRHQNKFKEAWTDLKEAEEIARLGSMGLHLADYHLEAARLSDAEGKKEDAQSHREEAKKLIKDMNYGRRMVSEHD